MWHKHEAYRPCHLVVREHEEPAKLVIKVKAGQLNLQININRNEFDVDIIAFVSENVRTRCKVKIVILFKIMFCLTSSADFTVYQIALQKLNSNKWIFIYLSKVTHILPSQTNDLNESF
jgi:hypothetical protein